MIRQIIVLASCILTSCTATLAQENTNQDPLLRFKHVSEVGLCLNSTRVNTNYTTFENNGLNYQLTKANYLPTFDGLIHFGWLFHDKDAPQQIFIIKTGVDMVYRAANVNGPTNEALRLNQSFVQIPIQYVFRNPLRYNTMKNNLYRAIEWGAGLYCAISLQESFGDRTNIDTRAESIFGKTIRFGFSGEIALSALNKNGFGHRFGIRATNDFTRFIRKASTASGIYPCYYSIGLFYNIGNHYW